jgi:L-lactate dehydrogenase complex protein LldG
VEERIALFRKHSEELRTNFCLLENFDSLSPTLTALANEEAWKKIATHTGKLTAVCTSLDCEILHTDGGYEPEVLETCDAGITECDALVAQTGSVLLTSRSAGGRALSALPPHHVVLARLDQLLPDLPSAMDLLTKNYAEDGYPSFVCFITGPSRTGTSSASLCSGRMDRRS